MSENWWTSDAQDGSSGGIYARRYNAAGVAQGSEFRVNTFTTGQQTDSMVVMNAAGDFVITWTSDGQDGSSSGVYAQRYNAAGVAQGAEFRVNTTTLGIQRGSSVAMDADGNFVVTWTDPSLSEGDDVRYDIFAQRYHSTGMAQGGQFQVNTIQAALNGSNQVASSSIAMDADGDFTVVWSSGGLNGGGSHAEDSQGGSTASGSASGGRRSTASSTSTRSSSTHSTLLTSRRPPTATSSSSGTAWSRTDTGTASTYSSFECRTFQLRFRQYN